MKNKWTTLTTLFILLCGVAGYAQIDGVTHYTTEEILGDLYSIGQSRVHDVYVTDSAIYLATNEGVITSRDDGQSWRPLTNNNAYRVHVQDNNIYAARYENGLDVYIDETRSWKTLVNTAAAEGPIRSSGYDVFAVNDIVYAATNKGIAVSTDDAETWTHYTTSNGLVSNNTTSMYVVEDTIFVGIGDHSRVGLSVSEDHGDSWSTYDFIPMDFKGASEYSGMTGGLQDIHVTDNSVYIATYLSGLIVSRDNRTSWTNYTVDDGLGSNGTRGVFVTDDAIYVATGRGLSVSTDDGTSWTNYASDDGVTEHDYISAVYVHGDTVYIATGAGLSMVNILVF